MNYCSIQDAWGKSNNMTTQFKEYMGNTNNYDLNFNQSLLPQPTQPLAPQSTQPLAQQMPVQQALAVQQPLAQQMPLQQMPLQQMPLQQMPVQQPLTLPMQPISNQQLNMLKPEELIQIIQNIQKQNNECNNFMEHINKCNVCYNKMKNKFRSPVIEKIYQLIQDNRDTILIILIGIAILLILNLVNNINKGN